MGMENWKMRNTEGTVRKLLGRGLADNLREFFLKAMPKDGAFTILAQNVYNINVICRGDGRRVCC
jgi:hypothetical protein